MPRSSHQPFHYAQPNSKADNFETHNAGIHLEANNSSNAHHAEPHVEADNGEAQYAEPNLEADYAEPYLKADNSSQAHLA